jgi:hypothetical protein
MRRNRSGAPVGAAARAGLRRTIKNLIAEEKHMSRTATLVLIAAAAALVSTACSSSPASTTTTNPTTAPAATSTTTSAAAAAQATTSAAATDLAGSWSGTYSGSFQGTFTLSWQQTGSKLSGTIKLSDPASTVPLHGSVTGSSIQFGTVGSTAVTYSGTFSGGSMSGTWQIKGSSDGGPWSASKTS